MSLITLTEAKNYLRVDSGMDDDLIISLLTLINMLCLLSMSGTVSVLSREFSTERSIRAAHR